MLIAAPPNLMAALLTATPTEAGWRCAYTKRGDFLALLEPGELQPTVSRWKLGVPVHRQQPQMVALSDPILRVQKWTAEGEEKPGRQRRRERTRQ